MSMAVPQTPLAPQIRDPDYRDRLPALSYSTRSPQGSSPRSVTVSRRKSEELRPAPSLGSRRQDFVSGLLPAAIGLAGGTGISPVGIFSNLVNAYATIDSKHDITGKLINGAASWFGGPPAEVRTADSQSVSLETTTSTPATTSTTTSTFKLRNKNKKTTTTTTTTESTTINNKQFKWPKPTSTSLRVSDRVSSFSNSEQQEYQSLLERIKAATKNSDEYDVVVDTVTRNYDHLPPQSNLAHNGPLRPKPPSEQMIHVSPAPQSWGTDQQEQWQQQEQPQLGVSNPQWFSQVGENCDFISMKDS